MIYVIDIRMYIRVTYICIPIIMYIHVNVQVYIHTGSRR